MAVLKEGFVCFNTFSWKIISQFLFSFEWKLLTLQQEFGFSIWDVEKKTYYTKTAGFFHGKKLPKIWPVLFMVFSMEKTWKNIKKFFLKISSFLSFIDLTSRRAVQKRNFDEICNEGRSRFFWTTLLRTHNHESHSISLRLTRKRHAIFCTAILSVCSNLSVGLVADTMKVVCTVMYSL